MCVVLGGGVVVDCVGELGGKCRVGSLRSGMMLESLHDVSILDL